MLGTKVKSELTRQGTVVPGILWSRRDFERRNNFSGRHHGRGGGDASTQPHEKQATSTHVISYFTSCIAITAYKVISVSQTGVAYSHCPCCRLLSQHSVQLESDTALALC
jgi:hypothetical protein